MTTDSGWQSACGKVILFGEHAVVYGVKAVAAGIPNAVKARVLLSVPGNSEPCLNITAWNLSVTYKRHSHSADKNADLLTRTFSLIVDELGLTTDAFVVELIPRIPAASGLGASAAVAVATIRAISSAFALALTDEQVNTLAYRCEQLAHGNPSGLDNTLATYGGLLEFQRNDGGIVFSPLTIDTPVELVVAHSGKKGFTAEMVAKVRTFREQQPATVKALFQQIDDVRTRGVRALVSGDTDVFAECLSENHRYLRDLGVSCPEIEQVIEQAKALGAVGGKLTGSGGGGAVILFTQKSADTLCEQLKDSGIQAMCVAVQSEVSG